MIGDMSNSMNKIDWIICLAWSLGHAILTALVGRSAVNASVAFEAIRVPGSLRPVPHRWVGRCKACSKAHRVDGFLAYGRERNADLQIVVSGTSAYLTSCNGTDPTALWVNCCEKRAKLSRVFDSHKPGRPRHECNAKCLASTGPACECKCKGANHGARH